MAEQKTFSCHARLFCKTHIMKRIEFVKKTGAAALIISMGISLNSCDDESEDIMPDDDQEDNSNASKLSFDLNDDPYDALKNTDSWLLLKDSNILIVNVDGNIRAFTSVCTHSGCNDSWSYSNSQFTCICHGSKFNNKGEVVQGPASSNLAEYSVSTDDNIVEITIS